ncbi:MAG: hypothetical protein K2X87_16315 [Gemmataceae bacterium]|nr:hypothetical protein [Gemmataceae bacterium]
MTRNLFPAFTDWTAATCYYVAAFHHVRMALLAGPYRTRAEAERVLPAAQEWAARSGRDPAAGDYEYAVHEAWDGSWLAYFRPFRLNVPIFTAPS